MNDASLSPLSPVSSPVVVTDAAAQRIGEILATEAQNAFLRVAVDGGGCSGFQYVYEIDKILKDDDLVLRRGSAIVAIDPASLAFLTGARLDYVDDLIGAAFRIDNPNASSSCGCGVSFSI